MSEKNFVLEIEKLGISCDEEKLLKLKRYYELLVFWNEKINLTAITKKEDVYLKHFYDSLTINKVINLNDISSLCDVGTGAGFPGIVLKIFFPHLKITLIDSLNKRIEFLKIVIKELELSEVEVLHARAEEYSKENREKFDIVTARAVSSFNKLLEICVPMVKVDKYFVAMRGNDDTNDAHRALQTLECSKEKVETFLLPIENSTRTIVLVKKNAKTNLKYPRKNSMIKNNPL